MSMPMAGILLVEDDRDVRESIAEVLEEEGYRVTLAKTGVDAIEQLGKSHHLPTAIVLDLMMPVMDGWQFRKEQKQHPDIADIPLVVITATGKRPVLVDAAELVMKPLDLNRLFEAIERYCP